MDKALRELVEFVPPPAELVGAPFDWQAVEATIGATLPADYKAYCDLYGHGSFLAGWGLDPLTPGHPESFLDVLGRELGDLLAERESASFAPFPAPGGLLAFASTETEDTFWWRTDTWAVIREGDGGHFEEHALTASEALLLTLRGDGPLEWGNAEVEEGEEPVDMTVRFHREGDDAEECGGEDDSWDEGGSAVLSAESVAGVWTMTVDLGGSSRTTATNSSPPSWPRRPGGRAARSYGPLPTVWSRRSS